MPDGAGICEEKYERLGITGSVSKESQEKQSGAGTKDLLLGGKEGHERTMRKDPGRSEQFLRWMCLVYCSSALLFNFSLLALLQL